VTAAALDEVDFEYATAIAEKAKLLNGATARAADAEQFSYLVQVFARHSPDLKRAIDILVGNKRKFDTTTIMTCLRPYVAPHTSGETDLNNVSQQLHTVMASAKQFLTVAIADNRSQIQA